MSMNRSQFKGVWGMTERQGMTLWARVGHAWEEGDGSIFAHLHACPLSGLICIKEGSEPVTGPILLQALAEAVQ
jgi:hypothetical protein